MAGLAVTRALAEDCLGQLNSTNQLFERFPNIIKHIFHGNKNTLDTSQLLKIMWIMMFRYVSMKGDVMEKQDRFF